MAYFDQDVSEYIKNHLVDKMTVRLSVSATLMDDRDRKF